ncbi:MAG: MCE family protein [Vicinamibacteria bacterium]|nr:MCE family protein [Vicinamibacteria bacterium]
MENRSHALIAGLFTIVFGVGLVATGLWMSRRGREPLAPYVLVSRTSVGGLNPQAPVRYRGVEVGKVANIRFDSEQLGTILIDVTVGTSVPVTTETFARLGFQGVTGLAYVELDDEGRQGQPLTTSRLRPARIETRPSVLQEFGDAGQLLLVRVNEIAQRLNFLLNEENQVRLSNTLKSIEELTRRFVSFQERLVPTVDRVPRLAERTDTLLAESSELMAELREVTRLLKEQMAVVERFGRGVDRANAVASDLHTRTLPDMSRLLVRLSRAAETLDRALESQAHEPQSLLFGAPPPEPGPGETGFSVPDQGERR